MAGGIHETQPGARLFESGIGRGAGCHIDKIEKFLIKRLRSIFAGVADECLRLHTKTKVPMYSLCFAAANERGAKIARRVARHLIAGTERGR
jgi:hypothetical protein